MDVTSIEFASSALPALDALSAADRNTVLAASQALGAGADRDLRQLRTGDDAAASPLYVLRVGDDLRLLVGQRNDRWLVLDIIRKSAMEHFSGREAP